MRRLYGEHLRRPCVGAGRRSLCLASLIVIAGCGRSEVSDTTVAMRDSAGVTIVDNIDVPEPLWRFAAEPTLTLGSDEGQAEAEFYRIVGAVRLADGNIVVGDGGSAEIRFFGPDGAHVRTVGGRGGGPGEFGDLTYLTSTTDDTLLAFDPRRSTIALFSSVGDHVRDVSWRGTPATSATDLVGRLSNGSLVVVQYGALFVAAPEGLRDGSIVRDTAYVFRVASDGSVTRTITATECVLAAAERLTLPGGVSQLYFTPVHFSPTPLVHVIRDRIVVGSCDEYGLSLLNGETGAVEQIARKRGERVSVTDEQRANLMQQYRGLVGNDPNPFAALTLDALDEVPAAPHQPPYSGLPARAFADKDGNLWVPQYFPSPSRFVFGEEVLHTVPGWDVFDAQGRMIGVVRAPAGFRLTYLGSEAAVGVRLTAEGVEQVIVYEISRLRRAS